ncbi:MAG: hypothetical protein H6718_34770 [Polyangiaceae bacterium]|nr:hypothetical protein [Myxococcales bacterium]MCB9590623.1 hypothetical protein [Polyangiaceae bacterium]MCB9608111.1 hypothetical protein [Polyangiaceae bacterium]
MAKPKPPPTPREELAREMSEVTLLGPVLDGLSPAQKQELQKVVNGLPPEEKAQLLDETGPYPERRPLLHLVSGGNSPRARLALATSSAGVEMLLLTQGTKPEQVKALLPNVREIARRAAAEWIRERSTAVGSKDVLTADHYVAIAQAAEVLDLTELSHQALVLAAEIDPGTLRFLELAGAAARAGAVEEAKLALSHAGKNTEPELRAQVAPMVEAAERLERPGLEPLERASSLVMLGRFEEARKLIPDGSKDLTASLLGVRVALEDSSCPGIPRLMASPLLCRIAFQQREEETKAFAKLDAAWQSKAGRSVDAVAGYVALRFALPFLYGIDVEGKSEEDARQALASRLRALRDVLKEASAVSKRFEHAALYVDVLRDAVERPADPTQDVASAFKQRATEALACSDCADDPVQRGWSDAAVIAVASRLSGGGDVRPLLGAEMAELAHPRAALQGWSSLSLGDSAGAEAAIVQLAKLIETAADRTDTVLELAELQHALAPTDRTAKVLESAGRRLAQGPLPFELRARGALDAAGIAAARGDLASAEQLLQALINKSPKVSSRLEKELLELVHCYLLVLEARQAKGPKQLEYVKQLKARGGPTAAVDVWRELWILELGRLAAKANCKGNAACVAAIAKRGRPDAASLTKRLGEAEAKLVMAQRFGLRSVDMALGAGPHASLSLEVDFRPLWLAIEVPY